MSIRNRAHCFRHFVKIISNLSRRLTFRQITGEHRARKRVLRLCSPYTELHRQQQRQVPAMMEHAHLLRELSEARPVQAFLFLPEGACQLHQDLWNFEAFCYFVGLLFWYFCCGSMAQECHKYLILQFPTQEHNIIWEQHWLLPDSVTGLPYRLLIVLFTR